MTKKSERTLAEVVAQTDKENPANQDLDLIRRRLEERTWSVEAKLITNRAIHKVIEAFGGSAVDGQIYIRFRDRRRTEMGYDAETAMVRMLIDNVILCELRMNTFEGIHASRLQNCEYIKEGLYYDKLLNAHHSRFRKACQALASVKRTLCEAELFQERARSKRIVKRSRRNG
jgi:hypothetical protein